MRKKLNKNVPVLRFPEFEGDWEISNVGSACEVKNNLRKPISLPERELMQGSYPYYGPTGIIDYLNEYGLDGKFALIGEDGDHFLKYKSWSQTQLAEGRFNANNHVHIISGTDKCLVEWFFAYFRHRNIIDFLTRQGAARYKLNKASLFSLRIALPSMAEQEKIASFLGAVDTRLNQLRRKRELLQTYKRGVMQKLFSQQIRFTQPDGSHFPNWERKQLGDVLNLVVREVNKPSENYLSIGIRSHMKGTFQKPGSDPSKIEMDKLYVVHDNDLIVNITFAWEGAIAIASEDDHGGLVSHRFPTYVIQKGKSSPHFFEHLIKQEKIKYILSLISPGGAGRNRVLDKKDFFKTTCFKVLRFLHCACWYKSWINSVLSDNNLLAS